MARPAITATSPWNPSDEALAALPDSDGDEVAEDVELGESLLAVLVPVVFSVSASMTASRLVALDWLLVRRPRV